MAINIDPKSLKYGIRQRYLAHCTRTMKQPDWTAFYETVSKMCGSAARRIQRLVLTKPDNEIIATREELAAFASVLECQIEDLANEAAERVVAG